MISPVENPGTLHLQPYTPVLLPLTVPVSPVDEKKSRVWSVVEPPSTFYPGDDWKYRGKYWELPYPQKSKEWFDARLYSITGSTAGACAGLSRYQSAHEVMENMGKKKRIPINHHMARGLRLEPRIIRAYSYYTGRKVETPGILVDSADIRKRYSPDGIDGEFLLEAKAPEYLHESLQERLRSLGWNGRDKIFIPRRQGTPSHAHILPEHYSQIQFGLQVTGLSAAVYLVGVEDLDCLYMEVLPADREYQEKMSASHDLFLASSIIDT